MSYFRRNGNVIGDPQILLTSQPGIWDIGDVNNLIQETRWPGSVYEYYSALTFTTTLPSFLSRYSTTRKSITSNYVGYTTNGLYINGDTGTNVDAYPVRTNFNIPGFNGFKLRVSIYRNQQCDDHGFCIFKTGTTPQWNWNVNSTRWAIQNNCARPIVYPPSGSATNTNVTLNPISGTTNAQWYSVEIHMPTSSSDITTKYYSGFNSFFGTTVITNTSSNPFSALGITSSDTYNIGFDTDQDSTSYQPKYRNMTITYGGYV